MAPPLSRAILIASLMISSAKALAETVPVMGLAGQSCGTWAANPASAGGVGLFYEQWIAGFLSGVSYADPDHSPLKNLAGGTALNWLENYCRENTPKSLLDAAMAFVQAHRP